MADRRRRALLRAALALAPLAATACAGAGATASDDRSAAPDFPFTTFEGQRLGLADFADQAVVLNFWASWCAPCRQEMPYFETTYRAYRDRGVVFVGLAVQDDPIAAELFLLELGITYPAGPDLGNAVGKAYGLRGLPTTVFITRDHRIARKRIGTISEQQLVQFVDEIAG